MEINNTFRQSHGQADSERRQPDCSRHEEMVTYLYDEATPLERTSFESHLNECSLCLSELKSLSRVRENLGTWNLAAISDRPRLELTIRKSSIESLREFVAALWSTPVWVRTAGIAATAAIIALVGVAAVGTRIDLKNGTLSFGLGAPRTTQVAGNSEATSEASGKETEATFRLTRSQIETMIGERIAAAAAADRQQVTEMRAQISGLSAQLASANQSQARLATSLATLRTEQRALAARGQSTLGEWLFAANGTREPWGGDDDKDN